MDDNIVEKNIDLIIEKQKQFEKLFMDNFVTKNELVLEKNRLLDELEKKDSLLSSLEDENESLKLDLIDQNTRSKQLESQIDILFEDNKTKNEKISLLKNKNIRLEQDNNKKNQRISYLINLIEIIKSDEINRIKLMKNGENNESE